MPLHLLGKKSWNVYNPENIARVQRDEAQAKAREEEDERRMQEIDAERRIQILRGERPPIPPPPPLPQSTETALRRERTNADGIGAIRKRRRLAGEDDTDRDIRIAQEDAAQTYFSREKSALTTRRGSGEMQAPLMDSAGHINLFPATSANRKVEKNVEAEAETARQERSYEDQYTMRFSNAAGFKQSAGRNPWYSSAAQDASASDSMPQKDVWGNEDPMRKERERTRLDMNDPLAAMKRGVRQLKATEQQRKQWNEEKQKELEVLATEERHSRSSYRRRRSPPVGRVTIEGAPDIIDTGIEVEAAIVQFDGPLTKPRIAIVITGNLTVTLGDHLSLEANPETIKQ
ncbi:hypothetical protein NUU61_004690 [Penicillium alfredii]|uniref:CBF1-interacting co-repressor CIR N-terminal domain-containing protein n=1 Tax=Penicillium alfredii TaxID=1506179 RepID=A0A9W9F838_9EURO|nr:uncharacterized protein NUU61_004690 [Penicillium alfredii]KAJ5095334.1 hypothetical protein NUU61_004690 [Penicillium alfredii]